MSAESIWNVVIADDEPLARARLEKLLTSAPDFRVVAQAGSGSEAVKTVRRVRPDLLFLDVQMPGGDGFEVLRQLGAADAPRAVVFVTAFDQHAVRAFEVHAADYLLKPYDAERFQLALDRVRARLRNGGSGLDDRLRALLESLQTGLPASPLAPVAYLERIAIKPAAGRIIVRRVGELDWIEADGNYVRLHFGKESHLQREKLGSLEAQLDPGKFARVHRSAVVNLDRIRELRQAFHGDYVIVLQNGAEVALGRQHREEFLRKIGRPSSAEAGDE